MNSFFLHSSKITISIIIGIFILMTGLLLGASSQDSLTTDESPHIAASYSYIIAGDYQLNPEHPPLLKLLSGTSLYIGQYISGVRWNFPLNSHFWTDQINAQWDLGYQFIFQSGNDNNLLIWWARLPTILLTIITGVYLVFSTFWYTKNYTVTLLASVLYAFSPTVLAHGHLVTTDIAATFGFLIVLDWWVRYLQSPSLRKASILGLALVVALTLKFSTILLLPIMAVSGLLWIFSQKNIFSIIKKSGGLIIGHGLVTIIIMWLGISAIYSVPMRNMSVETQRKVIEVSFPQNNGISQQTRLVLNRIIDVPGMQYIGHYVIGQAMAIQRVGGGNTTFLLGRYTNQSFPEYFILSYLFKEGATVVILTAISLFVIGVVTTHWLIRSQRIILLKELISQYPYQITLGIAIAIYWLVSINGNLNLGIRHILPVIVMTYILLSIMVIQWLLPRGFSRTLIGILVSWYIIAPITVYPRYISYGNIFSGGEDSLYKIFTDSNVDWGQDLIRLSEWTKQQNIDTLYLDYSGTADPKAYLGEKYIPISSTDGPTKGIIAISATQYQNSFYRHMQDQNYQDYWWLKWRSPDAVVGGSILIFNINRY